VLRRCLALLRRLQRGPAGKAELIGAVLQGVDAEAYGGATGRALDKRFEGDKRKLDVLFGLTLRYSRAEGLYEIAELVEPLLDLPDEDLSTIAFLEETFWPRAPWHSHVQHLLAVLKRYLPMARRDLLERQRLALQVQWGQRDRDCIPAQVEEGLQQAISQRRLIAFDYYSPTHADALARRHTVEPWERYFDATRGHYYLRGYCRCSTAPDGQAQQRDRYIRYRLGRIRNLEVLPTKLPSSPPPAPRFVLVYRLSPEIARRGEATQQPAITILSTDPQPNGSLIVRAETDDVWWAVQALLHYGPSCQVLGGSEALSEMRRTVRGMAQAYGFVSEVE